MHFAACTPILRFCAMEDPFLLGTNREKDEESEFDWDQDYQVTHYMVALGSEMMESSGDCASQQGTVTAGAFYSVLPFLQKRCLGYCPFVVTWDARP